MDITGARLPVALRRRLPVLFFAAVALGTAPVVYSTLFVPSSEAAPAVAALFGADYAQEQLAAFDAQPALIRGHAILGALVAILAPFQFWPRFRAQNRRLHRIMGYAVLGGLALLSLTGFAVAVVYPFAGVAGMIPVALWSAAILYCEGRAFRAIRHRKFALHEAWMARAMAVTFGVTLASLYIPLLVNVLHAPSRIALAISLWLGVVECLLVAEVWIRQRARTA